MQRLDREFSELRGKYSSNKEAAHDPQLIELAHKSITARLGLPYQDKAEREAWAEAKREIEAGRAADKAAATERFMQMRERWKDAAKRIQPEPPKQKLGGWAKSE